MPAAQPNIEQTTSTQFCAETTTCCRLIRRSIGTTWESRNSAQLNNITWLRVVDNYKEINLKRERAVANSHLNLFKKITQMKKKRVKSWLIRVACRSKFIDLQARGPRHSAVCHREFWTIRSGNQLRSKASSSRHRTSESFRGKNRLRWSSSVVKLSSSTIRRRFFRMTDAIKISKDAVRCFLCESEKFRS